VSSPGSRILRLASGTGSVHRLLDARAAPALLFVLAQPVHSSGMKQPDANRARREMFIIQIRLEQIEIDTDAHIAPSAVARDES